MTYIGWLPHIALEENVDVLSANYAFRKRVRVLRNVPRELASAVTPNVTVRIKARNLAEDSLLSIIETLLTYNKNSYKNNSCLYE